MRKIRLLWDFRGPDSLETAKHHMIHLKEFTQIDNLPFIEASIIEQNKYVNSAFIIISESDLETFKNGLKPHRITVVVD